MVMVPAKARDLAAAGAPSHSLLFTICSTFTPGAEPGPPPPHPDPEFCRHRVAPVDGSADYSSLRPWSPGPRLPPPSDPGVPAPSLSSLGIRGFLKQRQNCDTQRSSKTKLEAKSCSGQWLAVPLFRGAHPPRRLLPPTPSWTCATS